LGPSSQKDQEVQKNGLHRREEVFGDTYEWERHPNVSKGGKGKGSMRECFRRKKKLPGGKGCSWRGRGFRLL